MLDNNVRGILLDFLNNQSKKEIENNKKEMQKKQTYQKQYYNFSSKNLPIFEINDRAQFQLPDKIRLQAEVLAGKDSPRAYTILTKEGTLLTRNIRYLRNGVNRSLVSNLEIVYDSSVKSNHCVFPLEFPRSERKICTRKNINYEPKVTKSRRNLHPSNYLKYCVTK